MKEIPEKVRRLVRLQWLIHIATGLFSAIAIGLAFANQGILAQVAMLPVIICFAAACVIAFQRYNYNKQRRDEILSQIDAERDTRLRDLFNNARQQYDLPPDELSSDGYTAAMREAQAHAQAQANLPPGVKRRGGSKHDA